MSVAHLKRGKDIISEEKLNKEAVVTTAEVKKFDQQILSNQYRSIRN